MYPYPLFAEIDLYTVFLCVGVVAAIVTFRVFADKKRMPWRAQQLCILTAAASILSGYFSAVLFQALYNIKKLGKFVIDSNTGMTFYGGLIGGAVCFLVIYFGIGSILFKSDRHAHFMRFFTIADIAAASIAVAHAFGRVGCLMAGCCGGGVTDAWYGIPMASHGGARVVPTQLFEAIFLFALFAFFCYRLAKCKGCNLPLYMSIYGIWRFFIEFLRADERGDTFVDFLSPSQLIAVLMAVGAIGLYILQKRVVRSDLICEGENNEAQEN